MELKFVWLVNTTTVHRETLESKITEDFEDEGFFPPCHPGLVEVQFHETDPLEHTIKGSMVCFCGKTFGTFAGSSDGSNLNST